MRNFYTNSDHSICISSALKHKRTMTNFGNNMYCWNDYSCYLKLIYKIIYHNEKAVVVWEKTKEKMLQWEIRVLKLLFITYQLSYQLSMFKQNIAWPAFLPGVPSRTKEIASARRKRHDRKLTFSNFLTRTACVISLAHWDQCKPQGI